MNLAEGPTKTLTSQPVQVPTPPLAPVPLGGDPHPQAARRRGREPPTHGRGGVPDPPSRQLPASASACSDPPCPVPARPAASTLCQRLSARFCHRSPPPVHEARSYQPLPPRTDLLIDGHIFILSPRRPLLPFSSTQRLHHQGLPAM